MVALVLLTSVPARARLISTGLGDRGTVSARVGEAFRLESTSDRSGQTTTLLATSQVVSYFPLAVI